MDNTMSYATNTLANHMAGMAAQIGILQQQNDELAAANGLLKKQLKEASGDAKADSGTSNQPATAHE